MPKAEEESNPNRRTSKNDATSKSEAQNGTQAASSDPSGAKASSLAAGLAAGAAAGGQAKPALSGQDPIELLKQDHRKVEGLFAQFGKAGEEQKAQLIEQVCDELIIHTELEERLFYPASRQPSTNDKVDEAQVEHDAAKVLIVELMDGDDSDEFRDAKFKVLAEEIKQHIKEEEAPDGLFAQAQKAGINTPELAERMTSLKQQLQQRAQAGRLPEPQPVSFQCFGETAQQEDRMSRQPMYRERDEYGRFTSDDDDRGRYRSRGRYDEDDDRGYRSQDRSTGRERDERGRFVSEDDDERGYRSRGQGGWYGDREGHSEASRRGWDEREGAARGGRSYRDDDDDRRYASRGGGGGGRDRGQGGWFGDPEGHAEASRRGWDEREGASRGGRSYRDEDDDRRYASRGGGGGDRDRGQGGWFGDPEGHSEASRRGWDERERGGRGSSRYEERSYASRGRDDHDDDDDRRSGGRGHGGWSGDPEGHAEAARRGWQNRR